MGGSLTCTEQATGGGGGGGGGGEDRNKSQRRKLTPEKEILPPVLQGVEPVTFQSRVRH